jgi:serine/threonine protein kinase
VPGDLVDHKYVLRELIGVGGMGKVFLAAQPTLDRTVAIKIMHPHLAENASYVERFRNEAIAASRVHHARCIAIIDCGALVDGTPFMVMEHVRGRPMSRVVAEEIVPVRRSLELVSQVLSALEAAHAVGVTHGDVKCDNVLIETRGDVEDIKLIDFGLARILGRDPEGATNERVVAGTPGYMAPEVSMGHGGTVAADLYAVGVMLYELATGQAPFTGRTTHEIVWRHLEDVLIPPSVRQPEREIPAKLDDIVMRALAKRPEARFADASEFARAVDSALPRSRTVANSNARGTQPAPQSDRRRFPRGSEGHAVPLPYDLQLEELRGAIGSALGRGDVAGIAEAYLGLAGQLLGASRFAAAAQELQEGIDVLRAGASGTEHADRLALALAALYEQAGQRDRARDIAAHCDRQTTFGH